MHLFHLKIQHIAERRRTLANARLNLATKPDQCSSGVSPSDIQPQARMSLRNQLASLGRVSGERYKRHHARQYRLRVPHESKSRQDLIYTKKLRLAPDSDKQQ
ncbi:unnamed protein product, partial [Rotaria magnacalcarata]